jgi:hypothetical protein
MADISTKPKRLINVGIGLLVGSVVLPAIILISLSAAGLKSNVVIVLLGILQVAGILSGAVCLFSGRKQMRTPSQQRTVSIAGLLWQTAGVLLMISAFPVFIAVFALYGAPGRDHFLEILLLALPMIGAGRFCFQRGKKYKVPSAADLLKNDPREPVLYLRSFQDDAAAAANPVWKAFFSPTAWTYSMTGEEEQVAEVMNEIGPFVGIGRPGSKLPDLGAARMYVAESEWKTTVKDLVSRSRLIVFRLGNTPGFWWEIQTVVGMLPPEKILFLLPYGKARYEGFRAEAAKHIPRPLPDFPYGSATDLLDTVTRGDAGLGTLKALLYFERDWTPHLQLLGSTSANVKRGKKIVATLKAAMDPVVRQLGISWGTY